MTVPIFILFASSDASYQEELEAHLRVGAAARLSWTSLRDVPSGEDRRQWIGESIRTAQVVLLGISAALHHACSEELDLVRYEMTQGRCHVIPILLRPVVRGETWYGRLQPLPRSERPVRSWPDRDSAWTEIVRDLVANTPDVHTPSHQPPQRPAMASPSISSQKSQSLFSWLHVSDLHIGHGDDTHRWDQRLVLARLLEDARAQVSSKSAPVPRVIFVTGDIAFSGNVARCPPVVDEYADAVQWLQELRKATAAPMAPVLVVPGNHDIQRRVDTDVPAVAEAMRSLREGSKSLDAAMQNQAERQLLALRLANYRSFHQLVSEQRLPDRAEFDQALSELGIWTVRLATEDPALSVRVVGLNSTLLAADDKDQGKLVIGMRQLSQTIAAIPSANEVVMVLTHHPCREHWLADEHQVRSILESGGHVHLCGHVHRAEAVQQRRAGGHSFVTLQAGTAHGERGEPTSHGYSFGALVRVDSELRLRYWPRRFVGEHQAFRTDSSLLPDGRTYEDFLIRSS